MIVAAVILSFVLGIVATLFVQFVAVRRWLTYLPKLYPPYKQQFEKFRLPPDLWEKWKGQKVKDGGVGGKFQEKAEDQTLVLNVLLQFLFAELKDTARVRRWTARKLNVEFNDMLATNLGKFIDQIQVRDFNFGENFPVAKLLELRNFEMKNDVIQTVDVALDLDYEGGFQITLDVDVVFGAWAYLSVTVTKLTGLARLQLTRQPFTHWSFAFYEEPKMEFMVDSRFNGRPIPQISYLIVNQIKRTIRKKHILPSYKMRYKPLFVKPEENYINPELCFHGNKLGCGRLTVTILKCSRLQNLSSDGKLYCTLSVDKEDMEAVWRQCWSTIDVDIKLQPQIQLGLSLKDQMSSDKIEKRRVIIDNIVPDSLASASNLMRGDIIESIGSVRVLSTKHANKQLRLSGDCVKLRVKRFQGRFIQEELQYHEQSLNLEEDQDVDFDSKNELEDFVEISVKDNKNTAEMSDLKVNKSSPKMEDKFGKPRSRSLMQTGKRLLGKVNNEDNSVTQSVSRSTGSENDLEGSLDDVTLLLRKDQTQSAKSSPQKQFKDIKRQRAHSDTSLNKVSEGDNTSLPGDLGNNGSYGTERKLEQIQTREIPFSLSPEWNEEFDFTCSEDDQFVNVCVWYKIVQNDRSSKQLTNTGPRNDVQNKQAQVVDDLPQYDVTTKIGYVSIPIADIAAGCLLTLQGDTRYTVYLQPPEETITASRTNVPFSGHAGFDQSRCHGDITLSFVHKPELFSHPPDTRPCPEEERRRKEERRRITNDILTKAPLVYVKEPAKTELIEGHHNFLPTQFPSGTYCQFCGKKIWLKGGLHCNVCRMVCHKKCVEKCQAQTHCTREGPKKAGKLTETWTPPVRVQDTDRDDMKSTGTSTGLFKKFRDRHKDNSSLPLNIPQKQPEASPTVSPSKSPLRAPSPFGMISDLTDGRLSFHGIRRTQSNTLVSAMDREYDSDDDGRLGRLPGYSLPGYSLDDTVVLEAKEKGKELFSDLSLPERKKTLDEMVTKLQDTIDKESEYKSELMRGVQDMQDGDQKRTMTKQLEKCDEKMEALMMMMVHYCAGLQHCLDQEEAQRRLESMKSTETSVEDSGIQFVVTDTDYPLPV